MKNGKDDGLYQAQSVNLGKMWKTTILRNDLQSTNECIYLKGKCNITALMCLTFVVLCCTQQLNCVIILLL